MGLWGGLDRTSSNCHSNRYRLSCGLHTRTQGNDGLVEGEDKYQDPLQALLMGKTEIQGKSRSYLLYKH